VTSAPAGGCGFSRRARFPGWRGGMGAPPKLNSERCTGGLDPRGLGKAMCAGSCDGRPASLAWVGVRTPIAVTARPHSREGTTGAVIRNPVVPIPAKINFTNAVASSPFRLTEREPASDPGSAMQRRLSSSQEDPTGRLPFLGAPVFSFSEGSALAGVSLRSSAFA
jgi:hypothetical protein